MIPSTGASAAITIDVLVDVPVIGEKGFLEDQPSESKPPVQSTDKGLVITRSPKSTAQMQTIEEPCEGFFSSFWIVHLHLAFATWRNFQYLRPTVDALAARCFHLRALAVTPHTTEASSKGQRGKLPCKPVQSL
jgi:hypothetical protein